MSNGITTLSPAFGACPARTTASNHLLQLGNTLLTQPLEFVRGEIRATEHGLDLSCDMRWNANRVERKLHHKRSIIKESDLSYNSDSKVENVSTILQAAHLLSRLATEYPDLFVFGWKGSRAGKSNVSGRY